MDLLVISRAIIEISVSLLTILLVLFMGFKIFYFLTRGINELSGLKENNFAVAILGVSFIVGIVLVFRFAIKPSVELIILLTNKFTLLALISVITRIFFIYIISSLIAFLNLWFSIKLFLIITTNIDEAKEIKNNNTSVSTIIGFMIIITALIISNSLQTLLSSFVFTVDISEYGLETYAFDMNLFFHGILELVVAFFFCITVIAVSFFNIRFYTKNLIEIRDLKKNNFSMAILICSFILSNIVLAKSSIEPTTQLLSSLIYEEYLGSIAIFIVVIKIVIFFLLSVAISVIMIYLFMKMFLIITKGVNIFNEIKNNNTSIILIFAVLIGASGFLLQDGVKKLLEAFIKF